PVADKPVAGKPVAGKAKPPLKLAIIVFAADSEQLSQDATLVLTKVAAYIKQHPMVLRLDYAVGENAALSQKRRERIRDFLIRQAIAPDAIAPDEPRLPNADPNQVIIQAVPLGGTPPAG
ncbi:MAG: hypothetical protein QM537_08250, partial [Candidatus Symbiobacter sp.]|nr:hypothetical protein [Candidatus Symbiobacter sp.]